MSLESQFAGALFAGVGVSLGGAALSIIPWYVASSKLFFKNRRNSRAFDYRLERDVENVIGTFFALSLQLIGFAIALLARTYSAVVQNIQPLLILTVTGSASLVFLSVHPEVIQAGLVTYEGFLMPALEDFVYPLANILRILIDTVVAAYNFVARLISFAPSVARRFLFECAAQQDLSDILEQLGALIEALAQDLNAYFSGDIFSDGLYLFATIYELGNLLERFESILDCTCGFLLFAYEALVEIVQQSSFYTGVSYLISAAWRVVQLIPRAVVEGDFPTFEPLVNDLCAGLIVTGQAIEGAVVILLEAFFGFFTGGSALPAELVQIISVPYTQIVTQPTCAGLVLFNMTAEVIFNIVPIPGNGETSVFAADGSGIKYFQFKPVYTHLELASYAAGQLLEFFSSDLSQLVGDILSGIFAFYYLIADLGAHAFFYVFFPPIQFLPGFLPDYYDRPVDVNPIKILLGKFDSAAVILGNILGSLNQPIGDLLEGALRTVIALAQTVIQFVFYSNDFLTFSGPRLPIDVSFDDVITQLNAIAASAGNIVRQFDGPDWCVNKTEVSIWCCLGNTIESILRLAIVIFGEVLNFVLSLVSYIIDDIANLGIGVSVDLLDFQAAIVEARGVICDLACTLTGLIPFAAPCTFSSTQTCGEGRGCLADLICEIFSSVLIPFTIVDKLLHMISDPNQNTDVKSYTDFFAFVIDSVLQKAADIIIALSLFLDCFICILGGGSGCGTPILSTLGGLARAIVRLARFFTDSFLELVKIVITAIVKIFVDGKIVTGFFGFVWDLIKFVVRSFWRFLIELLRFVGLGFIADFLEFLSNKKKRHGMAAWSAVVASIAGAYYPYTLGQLMDRRQLTYSWGPTNECNTFMGTQKDIYYASLSEDQQVHASYCMMQLDYEKRHEELRVHHAHFWNKCEVLMRYHIKQGTSWSDLNVLHQTEVGSCVKDYEWIDWVIQETGFTWFPNDILANRERSFFYAIELYRDFQIYLQYNEDRSVAPQQLLTPDYVQLQGGVYHLSTAHYNQMHNVSDVTRVLANMTLADYFRANGGMHLEAIELLVSLGQRLVELTQETVRLDAAVAAQAKFVTTNDGSSSTDLVTLMESSPLYRYQYMETASRQLLWDTWQTASYMYNMTTGAPQTAKRAVETSGSALAQFAQASRTAHDLLLNYTYDWANDRRTYLRIAQGTATDEERRAYRERHANDQTWGEWIDSWTPTLHPPSRAARSRYNLTRAGHSRNITPGAPFAIKIQRLREGIATLLEGSPQSNKRMAKLTFFSAFLKDVLAFSLTRDARAMSYEDRPMVEHLEQLVGQDYHVYKVVGRDDGKLYTRSQIPVGQETQFRSLGSLSKVFISQTCESGSQFLCDICPVADAIVGEAIAIVVRVATYYGGGRYAEKLAIGREYFGYLADKSAPARLGGTANLGIYFPPLNGNALDYIGINGTLTRFDDFWQDIYGNVTALDDQEASGLSLPTYLMEYGVASQQVEQSLIEGSINQQFYNTLEPILRPFINFFHTALQAVLGNQDPRTQQVSTTSFAEKLFDLLVTCNRDRDLQGLVTRFSPVEMLLAFGAASVVSTFTVVVVGPVEMIFSLMMAQGTLTMVFGAFYFSLVMDYSYLCLPAIPEEFTLHFDALYYVIAPRCAWLFSSMINNPALDLQTCSDPTFIANSPMWNCVSDYYFGDLISNIVFFFATNFPTESESFFVNLPSIYNQFVYYRDFLEYDNERIYAAANTCAYTVTAIPNTAIAAFAATSTAVAAAFLLSLVVLIPIVFLFIYSFFRMLFTMITAIKTEMELARFRTFRSLRYGGVPKDILPGASASPIKVD